MDENPEIIKKYKTLPLVRLKIDLCQG